MGDCSMGDDGRGKGIEYPGRLVPNQMKKLYQAILLAFPLFALPIGEAPIGEAPIGEAPIGEAPIGAKSAHRNSSPKRSGPGSPSTEKDPVARRPDHLWRDFSRALRGNLKRHV